MEATAQRFGARVDRRHGVVRTYLMQMQRYVDKAGETYELRLRSGTPDRELAAWRIKGLLDQAKRLAESGLAMLALRCRGKLPESWAGDVIDDVDGLRHVLDCETWDGQLSPEDVAERAGDLIREHVARMMESLPPEGEMPELILTPSEGLRLAPAQLAMVKRPRLTGHALVLVKLLEEHPGGLTNAEMRKMTDIKAPGKTLRTAKSQYPEWGDVIRTPGGRGGRTRTASVYFLLPAGRAIDAPPSPPTIPQGSPKRAA
jgi:hypothetical protein